MCVGPACKEDRGQDGSATKWWAKGQVGLSKIDYVEAMIHSSYGVRICIVCIWENGSPGRLQLPVPGYQVTLLG